MASVRHVWVLMTTLLSSKHLLHGGSERNPFGGEGKRYMPVCISFDREAGMKQRAKSELQGAPSLKEDEEEAKEEGGPESAAVHKRGGEEGEEGEGLHVSSELAWRSVHEW